ncbi:MAG: hypothetical protein R2807_06435 [Chitinophagales bacterium]
MVHDALVKGPLFDAQPIDYIVTGKDYYKNLTTKKYEVKGEKITYKYNPEEKKCCSQEWGQPMMGKCSYLLSILDRISR